MARVDTIRHDGGPATILCTRRYSLFVVAYLSIDRTQGVNAAGMMSLLLPRLSASTIWTEFTPTKQHTSNAYWKHLPMP